MNKLWYGDCLTVMRDHMPAQSVDLIYLDPPFNSNREYNAIYKTETGLPLPDQIEAFCDTWTLDEERERALRTMPVMLREAGIAADVAEFWKLWMNALRKTQPRLLAYLSYMVERLLQMRIVLSPSGSIYLHCDPTASHYIKALMDAIFGHDNFRNEIIWCYRKWSIKANQFCGNHDVILFYSRSKKNVFNVQYVPTSEKTQKRWGASKQLAVFEEGVRRATSHDDEPAQTPCPDWWEMSIINPNAKERMGYATQKPLALLDRIVRASSNPGDVVFDPFCGCGTTLEAAHNQGRQWVGIDIAIHAIKRVAKVRLQDRLGLVEGKDFTVDGVPQNLEGARDLWTKDKYHFQKWAVEQVNGFVTTRRTADGGIDGRLYFEVPRRRDLQSMAIEVKGGKNVGINVVRELRGVLEREEASMAGLIIMDPLNVTKMRNFKREMATAGDVTISGIYYPRMQLLTVPQILEGRRFDTPGVVGKQEAQPAIPGAKAWQDKD